MIGSILLLIVVVAAILRIFTRFTMGQCSSPGSLQHKVVIVTGANSGIGFQTARELARRGARVILACRDLARGQQAACALSDELKGADIEVLQLDLASFSSVRQFVAAVKNKVNKVDILVNNAGIPVGRGDRLSSDRMDTVIQTNHLAHFLLTILLKDLLTVSGSSRVINVSSNSNSECEQLYLDCLEEGQVYPRGEVYQASKLMNILFSVEIARQWSSLGICSFSLHPGLVRSSMLSKADIPGWIRVVVLMLSYLLGKSEIQGAQTTLFCCLENNLVNGGFYADCKLAPERITSKLVHHTKLSRDLWQKSAEIVLKTRKKA